MAKSLKVSILNQTLTIATDEPEEHVKKVASYVNEKIKEIQSSSQTASSLNIALLVCLNIGDELIRQKKDHKTRSKEATKKLDDLLEIVDLQL